MNSHSIEPQRDGLLFAAVAHVALDANGYGRPQFAVPPNTSRPVLSPATAQEGGDANI